MIPSDHFVRFYNEVFKFLDERGQLKAYYEEISRHQNLHCLKTFWEKGFRGMYEYWDHIRVEENCIFDLFLEDDMFWTHMRVCPSLTKVLDNDATPCKKYCLHCQGWVLPLFTRTGFYCVYNAMSPDIPECGKYVVEDKAKAEAILQKLKDEGVPQDMLFTNLEFADKIEKAKARRHAGLPFVEE
jgi:hypothetical protein